VAIGNAARLFDYFLNKRKTYVATFEFGKDTDTLDSTGEVISDGGYIPTRTEIESVLAGMTGKVMQVPPKYSAKNINGKRGYELARAGVDFTLPPKEVEIFSIELLEQVDERSYRFKIECGGGTYIRSIARDMAEALNTKAIMSALVRTASGVFTIENSVATKILNKENIEQFIIPTDSVLPFDSVYPHGDEAKRILNGLSIKSDLKDGTYKLYFDNCGFYGLATVSSGLLKAGVKLC
jgi:tRNA pseudouridine55 synthase